MLTQLTIRNYALIRELEFHPAKGLTVITGETGAGKSIMLGAASLLLGTRADTKVLWNESDKCIIEGTFSVGAYKLTSFFESHDLDFQDPTIIRREISPGGKSRAFVNDTPVTLDVLRELGNRLMDIHSQHETLELGNHRFQLRLVDSFAGHAALLSDYQSAWKSYQETQQKLVALEAEAEKLRAAFEFAKFQLDEITRADFRADEQTSLETQLKVGENSEDIKSRLNQAIQLLGNADVSVVTLLSNTLTLLAPIRSFSPAYEAICSRLDSLRIEARDILQEAESEEEGVEFDPKKLAIVQERVDLLYSLMRKHQQQHIAGLLELRDKLSDQVSRTSSLDDDLQKLRKEAQVKQRDMMGLAEKLSASRRKAFNPLAKQLVSHLVELGIPDAVIKVDSVAVEPGPLGSDKLDILFSANKGMPPRPLADVASGGEFSRLMFCVKYVMARKTALPTLILDEIDTGVSGEIAIRLGKMMREMSDNHQLIAISHLPQIAAQGHAHLIVYKETHSGKTVSSMKELDKSSRIEEIAKMIGGTKPSAAALQHARELMQA